MKSRILDPKFKYVCAAATDIQATWRKFGWRPLNEMPDLRSLDRGEGNAPEERLSTESEDMRQ